MKRLMIAALVVLMGVSSQSLARPHRAWRDSDSFGYRYDFTYYGGGYCNGGYEAFVYRPRSLSDAIFGWTDAKQLEMLEKDQEFRQEQTKANRETEKALFESANQRGKIQHLEDTNQRLQAENVELKKKIDDMQENLEKMRKIVQELVKEPKTK